MARRFGIEAPIHNVVCDKAQRRRSSLLDSRLLAAFSSQELFVPMGAESFIVCPELSLLQLAAEFTRKSEASKPLLDQSQLETSALCRSAAKVALVYLMCEFRSDYSLDESLSCGFSPRPPLLQEEKTPEVFAAKKIVGANLAKSAFGLSFANSHSPEETALGLLLGLPQPLGGLGLGTPCMNHRVTVTHRGRKADRFIDLCYPDHMIAFEMNSDAFHPQENAKADSERRNEILALGFEIYDVTSPMLFSQAWLDEVVSPARKKMGIDKSRIGDYPQRCADLRHLVFELGNTNCEENTHSVVLPQLSTRRFL